MITHHDTYLFEVTDLTQRICLSILLEQDRIPNDNQIIIFTQYFIVKVLQNSNMNSNPSLHYHGNG